MNTKPTRKKWTRTEWLLLLAPLVIVIGIGAMNFAPQLGRAWREWREYGSNKPFAILHLQSKGEKRSKPSFGSFAFSPNSKQIAISENLINNSSFGNPTRVRLWRLGEEKPFSSWLFLQPKNSRSQVTQLGYLDNKTISASIASINYGRELTGASFEEKRDARNGRLMARKTVKINLEEEQPSKLEFLMDQGSSIRSKERRKDGVSIKVSFQKNEIQRPKTQDYDNSPLQLFNDFKVHFFADVIDHKKHLSYRFALADFVMKAPDSNEIVGVAFSPDLRLLFLYVGLRGYETDAASGSGKVLTRKYIEVFDTQIKKSLWRQGYSGEYYERPRAVAFSTRGLVAIHRDENMIEVRDTELGHLLRVLTRKQYAPGRMQFSPDGKLLAVPQDDRLELWDVSDLN